MAVPFSTQCPNCDARLKIQNPAAVGKKVRCPNCQTPFTIQPPRAAAPPEDFGRDDDFDQDYDSFDDFDEPRNPPSRRRDEPPRSRRRTTRGSRGGKKSRKKSQSASGPKIALIAGAAVLGLLLVAGLGFLLYNLAGGGRKTDMAWLPPDSEVVISVDVDDVWNSSVVQRFLKKADPNAANAGVRAYLDLDEGETVDVIDKVTIGATKMPAGGGMRGFGRGKLGDAKVIVVIRKKTPWNMEAVKKKYTEQAHQGKTYYTAMLQPASYFPDEKTRVMGAEEDLKEAITRGPDNKGPAEKFSFMRGGHQIVIGFKPENTTDLTRNLPRNLARRGGKEYQQKMADAMAKIQGGATAIDLGGGIEMEFVGNFADSTVAADLEGALEEALADGRAEMEKARQKMEENLARMPLAMQAGARQGYEMGVTVFNSISTSRSGENVVITAAIPPSVIDQAEAAAGGLPRGLPGGGDVGQFFDMLGAVGQARNAARRSASKNYLKQIGLAMHNFHDVYRSFPVAKDQPNVSPQLSWRVHLLPFVDQAPLYKQFHLNEPWNSPHNRALINQMPEVFRNPNSTAPPGRTVYLGIDGPGGMMENGGGKPIRDITDGSANTILVVEADDAAAVIWTKPDDYRYNPANPSQNLGGKNGGFNALLCDGSVRFLAKNINPQTLLDLFQMNDGHRLGNF